VQAFARSSKHPLASERAWDCFIASTLNGMELPALTWYATVYSLHICQQKEEMSTQAFDLIWIIGKQKRQI